MDFVYPIFFKVLKAIGVKNPTEGKLLIKNNLLIFYIFRFIHSVCNFYCCRIFPWIYKCLYGFKYKRTRIEK